MDNNKHPTNNPLFRSDVNGDVLPPPQQSVSASSQPAFPALGTTLSTYSPGQPGGYASQRPGALPQTKLSRKAKKAQQKAQKMAQQAQKPRPGWRTWLKRAFITLLLLGLIIGGYLGVKLFINASKTFQGNLFGLLHQTKLQGEDTGRVNILLAGNSADDAGHSGGELTDSIMLVSLDVKNNTAFMLSIPRDFWVNIPGNGYSKINSTYVYGKADKFSEAGYPAGGMGLLEKTVEDSFGLDINYYALVNYTAMRDGVNAVGGIDVTIKSSDPRGLYDPSRDWTGPRGTPLVRLTNGVHHLDGQAALNLARARGDTYGAYGYGLADFTRTENQRLMMIALKDKVSSAGVLANPIKVGQLLDSVGNNVQTDFQTSEVRRLAEIGQKIPTASIKSVSLNDADGKNLLTSYRTYNGQSALIPKAGVDDFTEITAYLQKLMTPPTPSPSPTPAP